MGILGFFGNMLTAGHKYSCHRWEKLEQQVQTLLSSKGRAFLEMILQFHNVHKILVIF